MINYGNFDEHWLESQASEHFMSIQIKGYIFPNLWLALCSHSSPVLYKGSKKYMGSFVVKVLLLPCKRP